MRGRQPDTAERLRAALASAKYTAGSTHNFYLYPARFSPEVARAVVEAFTEPGDCVLDPFMGGGTAIVESLSIGRSVLGVDLNALAHFVVDVKTRPLSGRDEDTIRWWAWGAARGARWTLSESVADVQNLPASMKCFLSAALARTEDLEFPRQRAFARGVLLRLGQWALDCRDYTTPTRRMLAEKLPELAEQMLAGLREFVESCQVAGIPKNRIVGKRRLLCRSAAGLHDDPRVEQLPMRPRLVFTSPPYPCVHVLYHRWQVRGRRETPAPYWIAQVPDGFYASHYTGGSRTPTGERNYFSMIRDVFASARRIIAPDAVVVQLVGFADFKRQLPLYLSTMGEAGFETDANTAGCGLMRNVPNRKWYAKLQGDVDASSEVLLFHRPRRECRSLQ